MALDAYSPCLCGSGKKFKWCCAPIFEPVERAFAQERNKQHQVALEQMQALTRQHAENSAVWCYLADLLMLQDRPEEAEKAIKEALKRHPDHAKALYLKALQHHEMDRFTEALGLYRRAADSCDPEVHAMMADIHLGIAQCETIRNHPFAAKAALDVAHRCMPSSEAIQEYLNRYYGVNSEYPPIVRKNHAFKKMIKKDALPLDVQQATQGGKLGKLHQLMEGLVERLSYDPAFFYNLGLTRAWVGDDRGAIEALEEYTRQANDEQEAAEAWCLVEAIRLGGGAESVTDYPLYFTAYLITDIRQFVEKLKNDTRIVDVQQSQQVLQFNRLDRMMPAASETLATFDLPRIQLRFIVHMGTGTLMVFSHDSTMLAQGRTSLEADYAGILEFQREFEQPGTYVHAVQCIFDIRLPTGLNPEQSDRMLQEKMRSYFEDRWCHRPLHSLKGNTPLDAVGHPHLRRKLLGCILLLDQLLASLRAKVPYTMEDLRRKLNLNGGGETSSNASSPVTVIGAMSAAELAAMNLETASDEDLANAFSAARRLDANDLATRFAQAIVNRAATSPGADCFIYDQHIIFQLLGEDRVERAYASTLKALDRNAKSNAGKRAIDYRKLLLKVLLSGKRLPEARVELDKLLAEHADNLDLYVFATEELLRFGHKDLAVKYAAAGKQLAAKKNDKDRLGFFEDLLKRYPAPK